MRNTKEIERLLSRKFEEISFNTLRCSKKSDIAEVKCDKLVATLSKEQIEMLNDYIEAQAYYEIEYVKEYGEFIINFYKSLFN